MQAMSFPIPEYKEKKEFSFFVFLVRKFGSTSLYYFEVFN
jgi:hypothetical protein